MTLLLVGQVLKVKTAVEDPETQEERAILLLERAKEAQTPATRAQHITTALTLLTSLPSVKPPTATGSYPNQSAIFCYTADCVSRCLLLQGRPADLRMQHDGTNIIDPWHVLWFIH